MPAPEVADGSSVSWLSLYLIDKAARSTNNTPQRRTFRFLRIENGTSAQGIYKVRSAQFDV